MLLFGYLLVAAGLVGIIIELTPALPNRPDSGVIVVARVTLQVAVLLIGLAILGVLPS